MKSLLAQPRRLTLTLLCSAGLAVAATAVHAAVPRSDIARLDGSIGRTVDTYTDGARTGKADPFTDGADIRDPRSSFTDGAHVNDTRSSFTDGA